MVAGLWHTKVVEAASRHGLIGATASSGSLSSRFLSPARAQLPDEGFARARCLTCQGEVPYDTRIVSNPCLANGGLHPLS